MNECAAASGTAHTSTPTAASTMCRYHWEATCTMVAPHGEGDAHGPVESVNVIVPEADVYELGDAALN